VGPEQRQRHDLRPFAKLMKAGTVTLALAVAPGGPRIDPGPGFGSGSGSGKIISIVLDGVFTQSDIPISEMPYGMTPKYRINPIFVVCTTNLCHLAQTP
jgi:hypothetical protein